MTTLPKPDHLILSMVRPYPIPAKDPVPPDSFYSLTEGAWIDQDTGTWLVHTANRPMPATKKADMETGEDQKGA